MNMDRIQFLKQFTSEIKYMGFERIEDFLSFSKKDVFNFKDVNIRIYPEIGKIYFTGRLFLNDKEYSHRIGYNFYEFTVIQEQLRMSTLEFITFIFKKLSKEILHYIAE